MKNSYCVSRPSLVVSISLILSLFLVSCGSFESVSYHDGVYGERSNINDRPVEQANEQQAPATYQNDSGSYYQALFAQKAADYGAINSQQDSIFTNVENYSTQSYDQSNPDYTSNYGGGYGAWGENPSQVNINIIDNGFGWGGGFGPWGLGFNNFGFGGFGFNGFGFGGFGPCGFGFNNFGYGGFGFNNFGCGGFGFNRFGFGGFGFGGFGPYGFGFNNFGFGGFGFRNGIAFANGNRGFRGNFNNGAFGRETTFGRNTTRRNVGRGTNGVSRSRATTRGTNRSNNSTFSRRGTSRSSNATNRRSSSRSSSARSSSSSRRSSGSVRSSRSSSSRSSGVRSSRSSGRSSGGFRSGGGRSGGRRG